MLNVIEAKYVAGHTVWLKFNDGVEGEVDLADELEGEVFEPLRKVGAFREVRLHPEFGTIVWPNGADFAPEFLHERVKIAA
jgi:hypothetical protein